jgi:hypothetical protein
VVFTVRDISCVEFGQLPSWCKSLLSVELLNGVLQELAELSSGRWVGQQQRWVAGSSA